MTDKNKNHSRHSIRLPEYDYSQPGDYFITIDTHGHKCLLGAVVDGQIRLNRYGVTVLEVWKSLPTRFPQIELGQAVVMPNHFHCILTIVDTPEQEGNQEPVWAIHELPIQGRQVELKKSNQEPPSQDGNDRIARRKMTIPLVVGYLKMNTAKKINESRGTPGIPVWHRNYWEHIITSDREYETIDAYIANNPADWMSDPEYS